MKHDRGNILFLILLAVVLFAALSYAVTSSMRGSGKDGSAERNDLLAAQIVQYTTMVQQAVMRAMLVSNVKEHAFDFSGTFSASTTNATCTTADCRLFDNGNLASQPAPDAAYTDGLAASSKKMQFRIVSVQNVGTSLNDVVLWYPYLKKDVCEQLNKKLGLTVDLSTQDTTTGAALYSSTMTSISENAGVIGDEVTALSGATAAASCTPPAISFITC